MPCQVLSTYEAMLAAVNSMKKKKKEHTTHTVAEEAKGAGLRLQSPLPPAPSWSRRSPTAMPRCRLATLSLSGTSLTGSSTLVMRYERTRAVNILVQPSSIFAGG